VASAKAFAIALAAAAVFVWWSAGDLPAVVASHFVPGGAANGFMPRGAYIGTMLALVATVPTVLFLSTHLAARLPARFVNVPNRAYWLAPERRAATLASLAGFGALAAYATLGFLCAAHALVVRANRAHPPHLEEVPLIGALSLFLVALFAGMVVVLRRFLRTP
jgi:serine/threonine-protein kinase